MRYSEFSENILKLVKNLRISWSVIGELVLGNVRIYQMQVEYLYGKFFLPLRLFWETSIVI